MLELDELINAIGDDDDNADQKRHNLREKLASLKVLKASWTGLLSHMEEQKEAWLTQMEVHIRQAEELLDYAGVTD